MNEKFPKRLITLEGGYWRIRTERGDLDADEVQELWDYFNEIRFPYRFVHRKLCILEGRRFRPAINPTTSNHHHHPRFERLVAAPVSFIPTVERAQVQPVHRLRDEVGQVVFRKPIPRRRRQQEHLIGQVGAKRCRHFRTIPITPDSLSWRADS